MTLWRVDISFLTKLKQFTNLYNSALTKLVTWQSYKVIDKSLFFSDQNIFMTLFLLNIVISQLLVPEGTFSFAFFFSLSICEYNNTRQGRQQSASSGYTATYKASTEQGETQDRTKNQTCGRASPLGRSSEFQKERTALRLALKLLQLACSHGRPSATRWRQIHTRAFSC